MWTSAYVSHFESCNLCILVQNSKLGAERILLLAGREGPGEEAGVRFPSLFLVPVCGHQDSVSRWKPCQPLWPLWDVCACRLLFSVSGAYFLSAGSCLGFKNAFEFGAHVNHAHAQRIFLLYSSMLSCSHLEYCHPLSLPSECRNA